QTLNQRAMKGELEITAISIHAYPYVADKYALTSCGSSMGDKYGPMIIAREPTTIEQLRGKHIAIPGTLTTAFLVMQLLLSRGAEGSGFRVQGSGNVNASSKARDAASSSLNPEPRTLNPSFTYTVVPFDQIPTFVKTGKAD